MADFSANVLATFWGKYVKWRPLLVEYECVKICWLHLDALKNPEL